MTLTAAALAGMLRTDGARVLAEHPCIVLADRPIAGMPGHLRTTLFHRADERAAWQGAQFHRWRAGDPVTFASARIHASHPLHSFEDAELWYGGALSIPVGREEVDALTGVTGGIRV